jgi:hypothetical protein
MTAAPFVIEVQWHGPDQAFAAGLLREGQPWILNGALVGMGGTQASAVEDLVGIARYLVIHGENFLTDAPLPLADREWLCSLIGPHDPGLEMHDALRAARQAQPAPDPEGPPA